MLDTFVFGLEMAMTVNLAIWGCLAYWTFRLARRNPQKAMQVARLVGEMWGER